MMLRSKVMKMTSSKVKDLRVQESILNFCNSTINSTTTTHGHSIITSQHHMVTASQRHNNI